ncbi:MAG: hypothetical protein OEM63_04415 [Gammaproteobacteria bacterium]|nr:hypothetical protein [Gammaproteobacteria bacterium]
MRAEIANRVGAAGRRYGGLLCAFVLACFSGGCTDGSSVAPRAANQGSPNQGVQDPGSGTLTVTVTDIFGQPVDSAEVAWLGPNSQMTAITDDAGIARLENVPSVAATLCAHDAVRGLKCNDPTAVLVPADGTLNVERQLAPFVYGEALAIMETSVTPGGLGADGRTLDVSFRFAVTGPASNWFTDEDYWPPVADCDARFGQELSDLGPRCVDGPRGGDASYTFIQVNNAPVPGTITQPIQSFTVGLLLDQSSPVAESSPDGTEARVFAAKLFADAVLPDTGIVLAAFAADDPSGTNPSLLAQSPVTFLPEQNSGVLVNKPDIFDQLDRLPELSGGVAPLHDAILSSIDDFASRSIPGTRRVLVTLADGRDDTCGTPQECTATRALIADRLGANNVELILIDDGDTRPDLASRTLATELPATLVVGARYYQTSLGLVRQLLGETFPIVDVNLRIGSADPDTFYPGAVIKGSITLFNQTSCPLGCAPFILPFSVRIP